MMNWFYLALMCAVLVAMGVAAWRNGYPGVVILYAIVFALIGYASIRAM